MAARGSARPSYGRSSRTWRRARRPSSQPLRPQSRLPCGCHGRFSRCRPLRRFRGTNVPKLSLRIGPPRSPAIKVSSPHGPAAIASSSSSFTAIATRSPVFCVLMRITPSRRCGRPTLTTSPRRRPVARKTSKATRSRVPSGHRRRKRKHHRPSRPRILPSLALPA